MSEPFVRTYHIGSVREGEEHAITLTLYPREGDVWYDGEVVATWMDNGVARHLDPSQFRPMSIRTLVPSNEIHRIFQNMLLLHYQEYKKEKDG